MVAAGRESETSAAGFEKVGGGDAALADADDEHAFVVKVQQ